MVVLGVGTRKGAFFYRSADRREWTLEGPVLPGWEVSTFGTAPDGGILLGTASSWYGAAIHRSTDLTNWTQVVDGPSYDADSGRSLKQIWTMTTAGQRLYAGVDDAGLFQSDDNGNTWHPVAGLNEHPSQPAWQPGLGGLCAHRVLVDPADPNRVWCAISAVGVFRSDDGGETWTPKNRGVEIAAPTEGHDIGYCVHCIVADPADADHIWRQDHMGVFRTIDGGDSWERIESGLPARFGFPIARDPHTGRLFIVPLESDEFRAPVGGALAVYVSDDDGATWVPSDLGLPTTQAWTSPLRGAMDIDRSDPCGVYFGTTAGEVYASADSGTRWSRLPGTLPRILSVVVLDA